MRKKRDLAQEAAIKYDRLFKWLAMNFGIPVIPTGE